MCQIALRPGGGDATRLQAVDRALSVLECFSVSRPEWSTLEIARELNLPKATVHRFLHSLECRGYVEQHPETRRWRLGIRILELARVLMAHMDVRRRVLPFMEALSREAGENVNLAVRDGTEMVYVERIEGRQFLSLDLRVGSRLPLHCSSMGKVLLAHVPEPQRSELVRSIELRAYTPRTITQPEALVEELERVRLRGYAICYEELAEGLVTVACPIYNHEGRVVAALNISGPSVRMTPRKVDQLLPLLAQTARDASRALGAPVTDGGADVEGD